jgi:regulatory protein
MRARQPTRAERQARRAEVDDLEQILAAALRFIEVRQRSVAEVRRRLAQAGYRVELIEGAIQRLGEIGVLDDEAFTAAWVESRDRARPRGERALRRELALKGVDRTLVDEALATRRPEPGAADDPDAAAARRLLERHAAALGRVADPRVRRQRAYALLARNGFDPQLSAELVRELGAAEDRTAEP